MSSRYCQNVVNLSMEGFHQEMSKYIYECTFD
jgi:hypothetical protein